MKRIISTGLLLSAVACSAADQGELQQTGDLQQTSDLQQPESVGQSTEALNGQVFQTGGPLTKRNFVTPNPANPAQLRPEPNELTRENDTLEYYYKKVLVNPFQPGDTIFNRIPTLDAFKLKYFNGANNQVESHAAYYNRGDLGLGRDMHCVEADHGEIACYVTNYASAPVKANGDFSEFTFGLSSGVAFQNMLADQEVATVAMVFQPTGQDKVIFMVYDGIRDGLNANHVAKLLNAAPLDRHGLNYANEFKYTLTPGPEFGTPGTSFNNHIPSNCLNCHGGTYDSTQSQFGVPEKVKDAYFLPFDLDQFEYLDAPGWRRNDPVNKTAFRELNQFARRVAYRYQLDGRRSHAQVTQPTHPIVKQIDGWYGNTNSSNETLPPNDFNSSYVPTGWTGQEAAYRGFVRPACRGCHMAVVDQTSPLTFDTEPGFRGVASLAAQDVANHAMSHALQTQRLYWQSSENLAFLNYLSAPNAPAGLSTLQGASAGPTITLDPHLISAAVF